MIILENNTFNWNTFSCIFAIVIGIIAFVSPVITVIINNYHQTKIKKLDMYEEAKRTALSDFIKACENYMLCGNLIENKICSEYYASINRLYIYFNITDDSVFQKLEETLKKMNIINSNHELTNIVQVLSKQIAKE